MSEMLIYKLLAEMASFKHPFIFSPFKVNEPFLDTRLMQFLDDCNLIPNMTLRLFTNGTPLTESLIDRINTLHRVAHLWVSLNSHQASEYYRIMGLQFDKTAIKLDMLHRRIDNGTFKFPVVLSKVTNNPEHDKDFVAYCVNRWPYFKITLIKQDSWLGYVAPLDPIIPSTPCARWFELSVLATGVVSLCCMDGKGEFPIGNVNTHSLLEVYNHPSYRERREKMMSRTSIYPCNTCSY